MEWNPETLRILSQWFRDTISHVPEPRRHAESSLSEASKTPNYGLVVLRLVAEPTIDEPIRISAAVNFKNHIRSRWYMGRQSDSSTILSPILDVEKEQIKSLIVPLMLSSGSRVQSQISEALSLIGQYDFPKSWPALLPELVSNLGTASQSSDYDSINGILSTANSIFKKFRFQYRSNDLLLDLKYCLENFAAPLLEIFLRTAALIDSSAGSGISLRLLFQSQRLCARIFYSLNFQDLPEFFEDHMKEWMGEFKKYLTTSYPSLEESGGDGVILVDDLRSAVCQNISLYIEKNEEEFQGYLEDFALAVWNLLASTSATSSRERLTIMAIKFLTTVSTSVHHTMFAADSVIQQIFQGIVIPNVQLREEDEELFDMNYVEFIRRDMEGSDLETRRRIACELLKGIAIHYKDQVMKIAVNEIQNRLNLYASNSATNWKEKDCAIYLVVSLAAKKVGGNSLSTDLVDIQSFFASVIIPELQSQDVNGFPILKASALKYFTIFRNQISKPIALAMVPQVVRFLCSESNVVHSYAASFVEKLLLVKEGGISRYTASDISLFFPELMTNLFNALRFPESEENPYVMKCIMRVLEVADISSELAWPCISGLTFVLGQVCKNPKNPVFNHYLFEAVAVLVRRACKRDSYLISSFENSLTPSLEMILTENVSEFFPYAFQLLSQLVELTQTPLPSRYMSIFNLLLEPESWTKSANTPALVRLLQAFLQKATHELSVEGKLSKVLGIFNMLILSTNTDEQGFYILNTLTENLSYDIMSTYMSHIWAVIFKRLQESRTVKFVKSFLVFISLFLVKNGCASLENSMNTVQTDIFLVILEQFWIPNLKFITGNIEVKLTSVATTRLLCESSTLLNSAAWGKMIDSVVTLLSRPEEDRFEEDNDVPDIVETVGYSATFVRLYNIGKKEEDPLKEIRDPKEFLIASLSKLSASSPGRYLQIISESLEQANQVALLHLCNTYKLPIV